MIASSDGANIEIAKEVRSFFILYILFPNDFFYNTLGRRKQRL